MKNNVTIIAIYIKAICVSRLYKGIACIMAVSVMLFSFTLATVKPAAENKIGFFVTGISLHENAMLADLAATNPQNLITYDNLRKMEKDIIKGKISCGFYINEKYPMEHNLVIGMLNEASKSNKYIVETMQSLVFKILMGERTVVALEKGKTLSQKEKEQFYTKYNNPNEGDFMMVEIIKVGNAAVADGKSANTAIILSILSSILAAAGLLVGDNLKPLAQKGAPLGKTLHLTVAMTITFFFLGLILIPLCNGSKLENMFAATLVLALCAAGLALLSIFTNCKGMYLFIPFLMISIFFSQTILSTNAQIRFAGGQYFSAAWYYLKALAII